MNTDPADARTRTGAAFGLFLLFFGALAFLATSGIDPARVNPRDPGPRAYPFALAGMLFAGGAVLLLQHVQRSRVTTPAPTPPAASPSSRKHGYIVCAAIAGYVALLPWAGFACSTAAFSVTAVRALGGSWRAAAAVAFVVPVVVHAVFVRGFDVLLPTLPGLPF